MQQLSINECCEVNGGIVGKILAFGAGFLVAKKLNKIKSFIANSSLHATTVYPQEPKSRPAFEFTEDDFTFPGQP